MAQIIKPENTFGKKCKVKGKEGIYWVVRKGNKQSRVFKTEATEPGEGELVRTVDIYDEVTFTPPKEEDDT